MNVSPNHNQGGRGFFWGAMLLCGAAGVCFPDGALAQEVKTVNPDTAYSQVHKKIRGAQDKKKERELARKAAYRKFWTSRVDEGSEVRTKLAREKAEQRKRMAKLIMDNQERSHEERDKRKKYRAKQFSDLLAIQEEIHKKRGSEKEYNKHFFKELVIEQKPPKDIVESLKAKQSSTASPSPGKPAK
ncbi:MAG: hypothetical protein OEW12_09730 [Deltaproteobacteria bacterium]|nr:hypothetical protein [Deltaproteobacteria bacterium]